MWLGTFLVKILGYIYWCIKKYVVLFKKTTFSFIIPFVPLCIKKEIARGYTLLEIISFYSKYILIFRKTNRIHRIMLFGHPI